MITNKAIIIGGPTASGKSALAVALAKDLNGVIINADSLQLYEGLPLLTAKPSAVEMSETPHRLYSTLPSTALTNAGAWRHLALNEIDAAHQQQKMPIIVGGTGFYLKTLLEGISPIPEIDPSVRKSIQDKYAAMGHDAFKAELIARDPAIAKTIDLNNKQRIMRALEVLEGSGKTLSYWQAQPKEGMRHDLAFKIYTILPPREVLNQRCDTRFDQMLKQGALDEVKAFKETLVGASPLTQALGYHELSAYLDGKLSLSEATEQAKLATRQYAKRQTTWFNNQIKADVVLSKPSL